MYLTISLAIPLAVSAYSIGGWGKGASMPSFANNGLLINTQQGPVQGFVNSTAPDVRQWLGVPYAQPPTGALRFLPPQSPNRRTSLLQTTSWRPSCMQQFASSATHTIYTDVVPEYLIEGPTSEDCLYLNVFAPAVKQQSSKSWRWGCGEQDTLLPVFVYLPGGGLTSGGAHSEYKIPDKWVQRTQAHIVVVINYRVNFFGFPNAEGLTQQNLGLLDQRAVVEWVQANIVAFGGDPRRIVLWGQSAGAFCSDNYGYAFAKNPIVTGLIADSGSIALGVSPDITHSNFTFLAKLVGCNQVDAQARLTCMRAVPAAALENASSNYQISGATPRLSWHAVPDEVTAFANYTDRAIKGLVAKIPLITGSNTNEGAGFLPYTPAGPGAATLHSTTLSVIACPVADEVRNRVLGGATTYRYNYAGNFTNVSPVSWMGAYHSSELPLIFGTHDEFRSSSTSFEYDVSHFFEGLWLSFAQNSAVAPSFGGFKWPAYSPTANTMALVASNGTLVQLVSGSIIDSECAA